MAKFLSIWSRLSSSLQANGVPAWAIFLRAIFPRPQAKFPLHRYEWREPIERFTAAAKEQPLQVATPRIGEVFDYRSPPQRDWWRAVRDE